MDRRARYMSILLVCFTLKEIIQSIPRTTVLHWFQNKHFLYFLLWWKWLPWKLEIWIFSYWLNCIQTPPKPGMEHLISSSIFINSSYCILSRHICSNPTLLTRPFRAWAGRDQSSREWSVYDKAYTEICPWKRSHHSMNCSICHLTCFHQAAGTIIHY